MLGGDAGLLQSFSLLGSLQGGVCFVWSERVRVRALFCDSLLPPKEIFQRAA